MKLSFNEAKLTVFELGTLLPIQLVLISKFAFGPEKLSGLSRNGPQLARLLGPVSTRIHMRNFRTGTSSGAKFEKQSRHCETPKL